MRMPIIAALLLLAGCGSPGTEAENATSTAPSPTPSASPTPMALGSLPDAFQGRWGLIEADCTGAGVSRMVVGPTELTFADTRAAVSDIRQLSPKTVNAHLAYRYTAKAGGWESGTVLMLLPNGSLRRQDDRPAGLFTYTKCER